MDEDSAACGGGKRLLDLDQPTFAQSLGSSGDGLVDKLDTQPKRSPASILGRSSSPPSLAFESISGRGSPSVCSRANTDSAESNRSRYLFGGAVVFIFDLAEDGSKDADATLTLFDEAPKLFQSGNPQRGLRRALV